MNTPTLLHATRWLNLVEHDGWVYASRRPPGAPARVDAVNVVALHERAGVRQLVVVEEWRKTVQNWEFALPAGLVDGNETLTAAAARELSEETGFKTAWIGVTSGRLFSSAGVTDESFAYVFCGCTGDPAVEPGVDGELIRVHLLNRDGCRELITRNLEGAVVSGRLWPVLFSIAEIGRIGPYEVA